MKDALHKFQHPTPTRSQNLLRKWIAPNYGSTVTQLAHHTDDSPALNIDETRNVQHLVRTFLYYTRAFELSMIGTLNIIAAEKSKITQTTEKKVVQLLNYLATHPEAIT